MSPLLPLMAQEFGFEAGEVGKWLVPAYSLAAASAALLVGPASDKFGRRRFLLFASALFSLSLISVAVVDDIRALAISRFFTGLAAGTFSICSIAYVGDYFPYARRGMAMSVVQAGYFAAMAFGVPGGSLLADWQGWRAGFVLFGLLFLNFIDSVLQGNFGLLKRHTKCYKSIDFFEYLNFCGFGKSNN